MKKVFISIVTLCSVLGLGFSLFSCKAKSSEKNAARQNEVIVYAYSSFVSEWGPGSELIKLFEVKTGLKLTLIDSEEANQIVSRAVAERKNPVADIYLGIDNNFYKSALKKDIFTAYKPQNLEEIDQSLLIDESYCLIPYDWSYFAIIYDTKSNVPAPSSLEDLTDQKYAKKLILMDPRTSTPGLGFLAWTTAIFGENVRDYWKKLKPSVLTFAPGWSSGYGLFTQGEAPLVISYTTSPAYHLEYDKTERYQALIFDEGHIRQIEMAGIAKNAPNLKGAQQFMDFLISKEAQDVLPLTQWMYPVNKNVDLPACYSIAPKASKTLLVSEEKVSENLEKLSEFLQ